MPKSKETKIAKVTAMLARESGASLGAICDATDWQAHSVRAAISGLRKSGHEVERTPAEGAKGGSVYRIITSPEAAS